MRGGAILYDTSKIGAQKMTSKVATNQYYNAMKGMKRIYVKCKSMYKNVLQYICKTMQTNAL